VLHADIDWHGPCHDAADLGEQVRARGAELAAPGARTDWADAGTLLRVEINVHESAPGAFSAFITLRSGAAFDSRRLDARECTKLRSAVAWLLAILAQQRATDREPPRSPSTAAFPSPSTGERSAPVVLEPPPERALRGPPARVRSSKPPKRAVTEWGFGASFCGALGSVSVPAFGPVFFGRYRPPSAWVPTLQVSMLRLATLGLESDGTSISLVRQAARLGAWASLGETVHFGIASELGQLVAEGYGSQLSYGGRDTALWFAMAVPVRLSLPVVARTLAAEIGAELDYTPIPYTFRYASGATLTSTRSFEGRAEVGLVCRF
jgi:hypothetical protein